MHEQVSPTAKTHRANIDKKKQDKDGLVDLSNTILKDGQNFLQPTRYCSLCGHRGGVKKACNKKGCRSGIGRGAGAHVLHATCAWEAGFSVAPISAFADKNFFVSCLSHSRSCDNLRAKIEDLLEYEEHRQKDTEMQDKPLTYVEAAEIMHKAIEIVRILSWAWRWEEWFVKDGFNWEPYIPDLDEETGMTPDGRTEADFTDAELRKVKSCPKSRQTDAEKCSLRAFGAAIRNRAYDAGNGFDSKSLSRALRRILHTRSLVGPLKTSELDFLEDWLGRAYRSKSKHPVWILPNR